MEELVQKLFELRNKKTQELQAIQNKYIKLFHDIANTIKGKKIRIQGERNDNIFDKTINVNECWVIADENFALGIITFSSVGVTYVLFSDKLTEIK